MNDDILEVGLYAYYGNNEMVYSKTLYTRLPSGKVKATLEGLGYAYLLSQKARIDYTYVNFVDGDHGLEWFEYFLHIPDELWEQFGFTSKLPCPYGRDEVYSIHQYGNAPIILSSAERIVERTACMTALLVEEIEARQAPFDISEYATRIRSFMDRVVPLTLYSTMKESLDIFWKELEKLPEDFWE